MFHALVAIRDGGVFGTGVVEFRHAVGEGLQFLLHRADVIKDRHALGENRASRQSQAVLRKVAGGSSFGDGDRAVVERVHAGQNLHQRGLAGTVRRRPGQCGRGCVISQSAFSNRSLWPKRFPAPES